ncbi:MAG TPA: glycosyltransferase [Solirubrobacteraceae bacterium]
MSEGASAPGPTAEDLAGSLAERYPRVAVSHEWLTVPGGSEKVVLALLEILPAAELFVSVYDPEPWPALIKDRRVHASFLNRVPGATTHYAKLLPLMDSAFRSFDLSGFDLIVSSNHACAKNVRTPPGAVHVCYCHTPMRYVWEPSFLLGERLGPVGRLAFRASLPHLRRADLRGARQPGEFVANSTVVAERIALRYGRESEVIHPPVEVSRFLHHPRSAAAEAPYLVFGRVVPYKRVDLAVAACERLGRPLLVAGEGRGMDRVRAAAGPNTTLLGKVPDEQLAELFARSRALLFPGEEDFGIVPVEAQAAGLPVIGNANGGVRDSVVDGVSGVLYDDASLEGLCAAIERFETLALSEQAIRASAGRFGEFRFQRAMAAALLRAGETRRAP